MLLIVAVFVLLICSNLFNKLIGHLHDDVLSPLRPEFISFFFLFFFHIRIWRLFAIYMGKPVGPRFGQMVGKIQDWKISSQSVPLLKKDRESLKLVSKTALEKWITNFSLKYSVQKNRTTFSDVPFLPGIFRRNDSKSRVPFTFKPDFLENVL